MNRAHAGRLGRASRLSLGAERRIHRARRAYLAADPGNGYRTVASGEEPIRCEGSGCYGISHAILFMIMDQIMVLGGLGTHIPLR